MRKDDLIFAKITWQRLSAFGAQVHPLPGIQSLEAKRTFIFQLIESVRRIKFIQLVSRRPIAQSRKAAGTAYFDPVRAAILYKQADEVDEASWLIFLFVHFGKNARSGYRLIADVYGRLGQGGAWTWAEVSNDPLKFRHWLDQNQQALKTSANTHRGFGNHRKYQSLDAWKPNGTGEAIHTYINWVLGCGGHKRLFANALALSNGNPEEAFASLYKQMVAVRSFGRTARFDFLAMIGKLGLSTIRPDSVHFDGATGPLTGARLLFTGNPHSKSSRRELELLSDSLATRLDVDKQVIEDSLCNWQKSPTDPIRFRG